MAVLLLPLRFLLAFIQLNSIGMDRRARARAERRNGRNSRQIVVVAARSTSTREGDGEGDAPRRGAMMARDRPAGRRQ